MIGVDTNVLVRHLVQDDPVQSPKATALIERTLTRDAPGFVSVVTVVETVWVLESAYKFDAEKIAAAVSAILTTDVLVVDRQAELYSAVSDLIDENADFADAVIGAIGRLAGCSRTMTFDRKAARLADFELL